MRVANLCPPRSLRRMSALAIEIDHTLRDLDEVTAARFERLVRDAMELVRPAAAQSQNSDREAWLQRLDHLRASVGTGKPGTSTEAMIDDLRSERGE